TPSCSRSDLDVDDVRVCLSSGICPGYIQIRSANAYVKDRRRRVLGHCSCACAPPLDKRRCPVQAFQWLIAAGDIAPEKRRVRADGDDIPLVVPWCPNDSRAHVSRIAAVERVARQGFCDRQGAGVARAISVGIRLLWIRGQWAIVAGVTNFI